MNYILLKDPKSMHEKELNVSVFMQWMKILSGSKI